jgi:hypothetical protein
MNDQREPNRLISRVDELMRLQREATEEVPVLTEVVEGEPAPAAPLPEANEETLAADLERALVARLAPELDRRLAALRAELEKELRRAVREAVAHALVARQSKPASE